MSNLKSDQSVDSVISAQFPDTSQRSVLEVSEVPRICIARGRNGSVGDTLVQQCSGPSPIPAFPNPPRINERPWRLPETERPVKETAPNKLY